LASDPCDGTWQCPYAKDDNAGHSPHPRKQGAGPGTCPPTRRQAPANHGCARRTAEGINLPTQ
jgi:hypothetical protein